MQDEVSLIKAHLKKPVLLLGMMGSGKSTIGRALADILELEFYDTDSLIEKEQGMSIPQIFKSCGEEAFRAMEREKVLALMEHGRGVISTGGGTPCVAGVMRAINTNSHSVWLRVAPDILLERIGDDPNRPLMQTDGKRNALEELIQKREATYNQADLIIENSGDLKKVLETLIHKLLKLIQ